MVEYSDNVGIAFAVVIGAGLSTAVGAAVVFFPSLIQYANRKTLASGLGLSAGVMTYVSFVEIFGKSVDSFVAADFLDHQAYFSATLCFFAGIILMVCLNLVIHGVASHNLITKGQYGECDDDDDDDNNSSFGDDSYIDEDSHHVSRASKKSSSKSHHHHHHKAGTHQTRKEIETEIRDISIKTGLPHKPQDEPPHKRKSHEELCACAEPVGPCCTGPDPVERLVDIHHMARNIQQLKKQEEEEEEKESAPSPPTATVEVQRGSEVLSKTDLVDFADSDLEAGLNTTLSSAKKARSTTSSQKTKNKKKIKEPSSKDKQRLTMMSLNTAVAIALHNFPEGLATFIATLQDPAVGAVLAIAIAIHNIPEGLCVAMPVYYATGNRWRAFCWGLLSGVSEPLAALLGWIVLASWINDMAYAVLFGVVAGMMVVISIKELLPTAHRYDPQDSCVTNMFILGMAIMAASLVLFSQI